MSGEKTFKIIEKIFKPFKPEKTIQGYKMKYGYIVDGEKVIDEVLISYFVSPKSYTTENMCEINSHGGMIIMRKILEICLKNGAELAEPGEFTKRAFLNGRIDLTQAEAIADVINAKSTKEAETGIQQLEGFLSKQIKSIKDDVLELLVYIDAGVDYPEYDIEEVTYERAINTLNATEQKLEQLIKSFDNGKIIKDGIKTVILGRPNAGKSSLLNEFAKEEKAIVTEIEGTTRDIIEEQIVLEGIPFKIIDTAGIRETDNEIEKIGIMKAKKLANIADLIIAIFDNSKDLNEEDKEILKFIKDKKAVILLNKTDLQDKHLENKAEIQQSNKEIIKISLHTKEGVEKVYRYLIKTFNLNEINLDNDAVITNIRHKNLLEEALKSTKNAKEEIKKETPIDIISIYIKNIIENLDEITGEHVSEEIIKGIFSKFCLGK